MPKKDIGAKKEILMQVLGGQNSCIQVATAVLEEIKPLTREGKLEVLRFVFEKCGRPDLIATNYKCAEPVLSIEQLNEAGKMIGDLATSIIDNVFKTKMNVNDFVEQFLFTITFLPMNQQIALLAILLNSNLTPFNFEVIKNVPSKEEICKALDNNADLASSLLDTICGNKMRFYSHLERAAKLSDLIKAAPREVVIAVIYDMLMQIANKATQPRGINVIVLNHGAKDERPIYSEFTGMDKSKMN